MEWDESLAIGIAEIDNQHKEIFRRVGILIGACKQGKGREEIGETLGFLKDYTVKHFKMEEGIQQLYGYPFYPEHKAMHEQFIRNFKGIKEEFEKKGPSLPLVLLLNKAVVNWLTDHIGREDKKIGEFMRKKVAA
ncbi:MAG: bacteriohemerythrin [Nitrospirota bacterium]